MCANNSNEISSGDLVLLLKKWKEEGTLLGFISFRVGGIAVLGTGVAVVEPKGPLIRLGVGKLFISIPLSKETRWRYIEGKDMPRGFFDEVKLARFTTCVRGTLSGGEPVWLFTRMNRNSPPPVFRVSANPAARTLPEPA